MGTVEMDDLGLTQTIPRIPCVSASLKQDDSYPSDKVPITALHFYICGISTTWFIIQNGRKLLETLSDLSKIIQQRGAEWRPACHRTLNPDVTCEGLCV